MKKLKVLNIIQIIYAIILTILMGLFARYSMTFNGIYVAIFVILFVGFVILVLYTDKYKKLNNREKKLKYEEESKKKILEYVNNHPEEKLDLFSAIINNDLSINILNEIMKSYNLHFDFIYEDTKDGLYFEVTISSTPKAFGKNMYYMSIDNDNLLCLNNAESLDMSLYDIDYLVNEIVKDIKKWAK